MVNLHTTFRVGGLTCHLLDGGRLHLDGGAMFGVVPKPLWERKITPDPQNRIPLAVRCFLIEHEAGPVLVDTGIGNKENEKFQLIYRVANAGKHGPTQLEDALQEAGFAPGDIRFVINTHLHFDHAGGNTFIESGERQTTGEGGSGTGEAIRPSAYPPIRLSFPNATYVVQRREVDFATHANERTAASYLRHNFDAITAAGRWKLVDGPTDLLPGIQLVPTPGHVPNHQSVLVQDGGETACFLADLVPTTAHVPLPWIMGYDLEPLVTLESKRQLLTRAEREGWKLLFEHDAGQGIGSVVKDGKSFAFVPA